MTEGPPKPPTPSQRQEKELSRAELREKMRDPSFLPTQDDITRAFESKDDFNDFCHNEENPVYEFLNQEFIESFGGYLSKRIEKLGGTKDNPVVILEVGAGNGRLSHFLQQRLESKIPGACKVIATDSGEWELKNVFPVEKVNHEEALKKYRPQIVVFSWMPYNEDYTDSFRSTDSVQEYILLGEVGGCCGQDWLTWGNKSSWFEDEEEGSPKEVAPYEKDGFEIQALDDISDTQICCTDKPGRYWHSRTMSFQRKK